MCYAAFSNWVKTGVAHWRVVKAIGMFDFVDFQGRDGKVNKEGK